MPIVFKASYKDDIRRLSFPSLPSFAELSEKLKQLFQLKGIILKYTDPEGDKVTGALPECLPQSSETHWG